MVRILILFCLLTLPAAADPVRFVERTDIEGTSFRIPMAVDMVAETATRLRLTVSGDLGEIQKNLPALLSRHIEEDCGQRTSIAVTDVVAEEDRVRLTGQLQAYRWLCPGGKRGAEMLRQTAQVETVLGGRIENGCLVMRVVSSDVRPDGLTGALMNMTGFTARLNRGLEEQLDKALQDSENCIDLPAEFRAFDAKITGGGFRDIGEGRLGAVLNGVMEISASNFISLVHLLGRQGKLGD